ncbi:MAG: hypothetical protein ABSF10_00545 [Verrucomicrobiota bacterium]|jgi:hypothetical protein
MKLTKLTVLAATAAFVLNASAKLPLYCESVVFKATVLTENGAKVVQTKITTDDILGLIDNEYGRSYAKKDGGKGYQLVSEGVGRDYSSGYDIFSVADKDGNIVLANASFNGDAYYLYLYPYDGNWVESYKGANYNYTAPQVEVYYNSSDDNDSFYVTGLMTDKVNWDSYNESYSLKNGQGSIEFDDEDIYGPIMGASVSGSGKDVDYPFNW